MEGVFNIFKLPVGKKKTFENATISAFEYKRSDNPLDYVRRMMEGLQCEDGKYVKLIVDGELVMSDTSMEKRSNMEFVHKAHGNVLVAGLGIGLIIKNVWDKLQSGEITKLTIIEKHPDVIKLVGPYYKHKRVEIIHADIMDWRPPKETKYDIIYFDIWPTIDAEKNLPEIRYLHNAFKSRLNRSNQNCWMDSWMKYRMQQEKRSCYY